MSTAIVEGLTSREEEVLRHLMEGRTNKQIAYSLGIALDTVKSYVCSIMGKMGVGNRTQAAVIAIRLQQEWEEQKMMVEFDAEGRVTVEGKVFSSAMPVSSFLRYVLVKAGKKMPRFGDEPMKLRIEEAK